MKSAPQKFDHFLNQLQTLFVKAAAQKNAALWLYQNNVRTPLFMLEGLCKLYAELHNHKKFTNLKTYFKELEDGFGQIDYYDNFAKELAKNKKIPTSLIQYLQSKTIEKTNMVNTILVEKKWINVAENRIKKFQKKLQNADWLKDEKEITAIKKFYIDEINNIQAFVNKTQYKFTNVENDVHELRRKLRWLSIYPQALRGSIQLQPSKNNNKQLAKYLTKEITTSPFNVMPKSIANAPTLLLNGNNFYALSWMIAELGKIKDAGLKIIIIVEALMNSEKITNLNATKKAYQILGETQPKLNTLLKQAELICKTYFEEGSLNKLVI